MNFSDLVAQARGFKKVTSDSRQVGPGVVFVAVRGHSYDSHAHVPKAAEQGAVAIVGEEPASTYVNLGVPYIQVSDSRDALAELAAAHYDHPSRAMVVCGVTGTSGKTTTAFLLESILRAAGHKVGLIGTVILRIGDKVIPSNFTTPAPDELQDFLAQMRDAGCTAVVMEVSSHGLKQKRAHHIAFDGMVFTNLSPEHLDYHPDMDDYFATKSILFTDIAEQSRAMGKSPVASINGDDAWGAKLIERLKGDGARAPKIEIFSVDGANLQADLAGVRGRAHGVEIQSQLAGRFNAANILGATALATGLRLPAEAIARGIRDLACVPGRLERVPHKDITVLVDYAHKPDALEKVLRALREGLAGTQGRLLCVVGCGGDRDRTKRPVMGKLAVTIADHAIITSDNPRTEDPDAIIREILVGTQGHSNLTVEADRKNAIHAAIRMARPGDCVVIAGKGHEDYQIIRAPEGNGTVKIHFDDREVAAEALAAR